MTPQEYNPEDETYENIEKELQAQLNNDIINNHDQKISSIQMILGDISVTLDLNTLTSTEELAQQWGISVSMARQTIERMTQLAMRDFTNKQGTKRLKHM